MPELDPQTTVTDYCIKSFLWYASLLVFPLIFFKFTGLWQWIRLKLQAKYFANYGPKSNTVKELVEEKTKLYEPMQGCSSSTKPLHILEVGAAECYNIQFYPKNSILTLVEPNENFHQGLRDRIKAVGRHVIVEDIFADVAENLKSVESDSIDEYVLTYVLCSVNNLEETMREAKRVLKKGGRMYVIHHYRGPHAFAFEFNALLERFFLYPILNYLIFECSPDVDVEPIILKYFPNSKCWRKDISLPVMNSSSYKSHFMSVSVKD